MIKKEIIETLKNSYNKEIRKQLIKSVLANEKSNDKTDYKLINQIFSYVLSECGWDISKNTSQWDTTPLDIMREAFPRIETTQWYKEKILTTKKDIGVEIRE